MTVTHAPLGIVNNTFPAVLAISRRFSDPPPVVTKAWTIPGDAAGGAVGSLVGAGVETA